MKIIIKIFLLLTCAFSLLTSFSNFHKTAISKIRWSDWKWFDQKNEDLEVSFRIYTQNECKELLEKDLVARGYRPIQLDIINSSSNEYEMSPSDISLPSEKSSKIARKIMKSAIPRSILFKIAGLLFWPASIIGTIDSLNSLSSYDDMRSQWKAMSVHENEKIPPFSSIHRIIFVPEEHLSNRFTVQLKNVKSGEYQIFDANASLQLLAESQDLPDVVEEIASEAIVKEERIVKEIEEVSREPVTDGSDQQATSVFAGNGKHVENSNNTDEIDLYN